MINITWKEEGGTDMSKNLKNQDNREQSCLEYIRSNLSKEICLGVSDQKYIELENFLKDAKLNKCSSKFPDFIFNDGFIEHFAVTSSFEGRKGAKQKIASSNLKSNSKNDFFNKLDGSEVNTLVNHSSTRLFEDHSHNNIVNSIQKNWKKHIKSYENYSTQCKHGIFLLEYIDMNIETGILRENKSVEVLESYRISADKDLLKWIYNFKEKIEYLILLSPLSIEVVRLDQILEIISCIPNARFEPVIGMESHKYIGFKSPMT